jgi:trans-aconitate 2-methyltransferase
MPAAPTWDPQQYLRHAGHRTRPFHDLLARVAGLPAGADRPARIADLGCGPGNVTALLADRWPTADITGFDNSDEMLRDARRTAGRTLGGSRLVRHTPAVLRPRQPARSGQPASVLSRDTASVSTLVRLQKAKRTNGAPWSWWS